jgi:peptide/nickel transport system permease protein
MLIALPVGILSALRPRSMLDRIAMVFVLVGISAHPVWIGLIFAYFFGFKLGVFPISGYADFFSPTGDVGGPVQWAYHLILPWTTLALLFVGFYSRVLRSDVLDTAGEDYVRTARAKGLSERRILLRHILRNSLIPIVTLWGLDFGAVVGGGAILTEKVFDLQGVGQYAADAVGHLDVPPVLAITMFGAFFIVLLSALVDIAYAALDPRIRTR